MVTKTPTHIVIDTEILSQIISDTLDLVGAPGSKKSACLNKAAARIAGPKHNFGYLTGRDKPVIAKGVAELTTDAPAPETPVKRKMVDPSKISPNDESYRARGAAISDVLLGNKPMLLLSGFVGDGKLSHVEEIAHAHRRTTHEISVRPGGSILDEHGKLSSIFRPARHNGVVNIYSDIGHISIEELKILEREVFSFLAERTDAVIIITTHDGPADLAKIEQHAPGLLVHCETHNFKIPRPSMTTSMGPVIPVSDHHEAIPTQANPTKAGWELHAEGHKRSAAALARHHEAQMHAQGEPNLWPELHLSSPKEIAEFIMADMRLSPRVADYIKENADAVQRTLDSGQVPPRVWLSAARIVRIDIETSCKDGEGMEDAMVHTMRMFAKSQLLSHARNFLKQFGSKRRTA